MAGLSVFRTQAGQDVRQCVAAREQFGRGGDEEQAVRAATPMGELIRPEDVANAVAFLVSDQSARITGEVLHVCAGSQLPLFLT